MDEVINNPLSESELADNIYRISRYLIEPLSILEYTG
jgi:hypothetical protein